MQFYNTTFFFSFLFLLAFFLFLPSLFLFFQISRLASPFCTLLCPQFPTHHPSLRRKTDAKLINSAVQFMQKHRAVGVHFSGVIYSQMSSSGSWTCQLCCWAPFWVVPPRFPLFPAVIFVLWKEKILKTLCESILFYFFLLRGETLGLAKLVAEISSVENLISWPLMKRSCCPGKFSSQGNKTWVSVEMTGCKSERFWCSTEWKDRFQTDQIDLLNL